MVFFFDPRQLLTCRFAAGKKLQLLLKVFRYLPVASGWLVVFELGKLELVGTARSSEGSAALEVFEQTDWTRHRLGR